MITFDFSYFGQLRHKLAPADRVIKREAATIHDALRLASDYLNVEIVPYNSDRYFSVWEREQLPPQTLHPVLDIHILRDGVEFCPKHDLSFSLLDGDIVKFLSLIC